MLSLVQLIIVLDFSIVNVALPSIQTQFELAPSTCSGGESLCPDLRGLPAPRRQGLCSLHPGGLIWEVSDQFFLQDIFFMQPG
jgi:hypothetical protein